MPHRSRAATTASPPRSLRSSGRWWGRHSVLVRLVAMALLIAGCSIAATAWIAADSTSESIHQQYSDDLSSGAQIYDAMLGFAASHPSWTGVGAVAAPLAERTERRIVLTTDNGEQLYASGDVIGPLPETPAAVINPLSVSAFPGLARTAGGIDARAVGPFHLTIDEAARVRIAADHAMDCLSRIGIPSSSRVLPTGRTIVDIDPDSGNKPRTGLATRFPPPAAQARPTSLNYVLPALCSSPLLTEATTSEQTAMNALRQMFVDCLTRAGFSGLVTELYKDSEGLRVDLTSEELVTASNPAARPCLDAARRQQLAPYVAPPAVLYLIGSVAAVPPAGLSAQVKQRIVLSSLAVLAIAVGVAALAAVPLVRPLHALTMAAQRVGSGDRSARVKSSDAGQIGALTTAFNTMASELESAERQRKQLVSDVAHELRTPLGNIRGWLEAAQDGVAPFNTELAQSLLDESLLLQHVIDDLQDLALAEAGELLFHPEPMDAAAMVRQVAAAHLAKAEAAGVSIAVEAPASIQLTADVSRLRQAVGNLVTNAVRYTPAGGQVTLRAGRVGDQVTIEVVDTGIGIRAEDIPRVFDRFWRAEQSRNRSSGGSGLGLAITRHLIEAHHGTITVHSELRAGSSFTIKLPAE